jgi:Porin subfamily
MLRRSFLIVPLFAVAAFAAGGAAAAQDQTTKPPKLKNLHASDAATKPVRPRPATSCAEFGAGFARLPGSDTCMRIGGSVSAGAGGRF